MQAKLTISHPDDPYEREADRVADTVMRMAEPGATEEEALQVQAKPLAAQITPLVQRTPALLMEEEEKTVTPPVSLCSVPSSGYGIQRLCTECEDELAQTKSFDNGLFAVKQPRVQRKEEPALTSAVTPSVSANIRALPGGGNPLPQATRAFFEPRFGADLSQVRVHTGARAGETAKSINARAFTVGRDIAFGAGQYAPESQAGRRLLAHELTHTIQQGSAKHNSPAQISMQKTSGHQVMRSLALDSTVKICHRVLTSRKMKVSQGGLRVVLLLNSLDTEIPNCKNHRFWVSLTRSVDWWPDDEIATCEGETGGTRSFSFGNLSSGTYYLTIHRVFDHPYCCIEGDILVFDEPISGDSSGCVRDKDLSAMDIVHGALDIAGFIPVLGAIPDGINAAIYVVEGDWANAGLSAVAMVPAWGDGVKLGTIAGKSAIKISEKAAIKLGEEGIAKGLKEVKAASKATHAGEDVAKAAEKLEKEAAEKLEKEAAEKLEKEAAEKLEKEAAEKLEKEAAEKAEKEAAEKKKKEKKSEETCATRFPLALNCSRLPFSFTFHSPQAALAALKLSTGKSNLKLVSPNPSTGGPCPGIGMHYGVKDGGVYIASISCCPCCIDTPAGPRLVTRCRII
jgi:hypothetical protein